LLITRIAIITGAGDGKAVSDTRTLPLNRPGCSILDISHFPMVKIRASAIDLCFRAELYNCLHSLIFVVGIFRGPHYDMNDKQCASSVVNPNYAANIIRIYGEFMDLTERRILLYSTLSMRHEFRREYKEPWTL
jgi:hypothetical protein